MASSVDGPTRKCFNVTEMFLDPEMIHDPEMFLDPEMILDPVMFLDPEMIPVPAVCKLSVLELDPVLELDLLFLTKENTDRRSLSRWRRKRRFLTCLSFIYFFAGREVR